jgi:hypothetical protein
MMKKIFEKFIEILFLQEIFYNEPFWDMLKNEGLQIFVKLDLNSSTFGPEHKTERCRLIEVIDNFWELVAVGKIVVFCQKQLMFSSNFMIIFLSRGSKIKITAKF